MPEPSLPACPLCIYLYAHMYCTYVSVTPRWCGFCSRASHVIFTDFSNFACLPYRSLLLGFAFAKPGLIYPKYLHKCTGHTSFRGWFSSYLCGTFLENSRKTLIDKIIVCACI